MKSLFNNISQEEKNRILEMHSAKKNVISEQSTFPGQPIRTQPSPRPRTRDNEGVLIWISCCFLSLRQYQGCS